MNWRSTHGRFWQGAWLLAASVSLAGCAARPEVEAHADHDHEESWSVTVWGERYEIFPEIGPLVVGEVATAHTHVTRLADFSPMRVGTVEIVLSGPAGEQVFGADRVQRPGIFAIEIEPATAGEFELLFRISEASGSEEIRSGRVRVGSVDDPGGLWVQPAPPTAASGGEPVSFLKEQQWQTPFATSWVSAGQLPRSFAGLAKVRPPAGGEAVVTSPVDGVLQPVQGASSWPYVGQRVERGSRLFRVVPLVAAERSLAALEALVAEHTVEQAAAQARLARLEELLGLEATSQRQVEEARVRVATLAARQTAAERDLAAARSARQGGTEGGLDLSAPFSGEIARLDGSPGATVRAGDALARLVRTDRVWIEVRLAPAAARLLAEHGVLGVVLDDPETGSIRLEEGLRWVSAAPEVAPETGTVTVLLEAPASAGLVLGTAVEARVLATAERSGVVIPATAVVDDSGESVVYLQVSGEGFVRQQVEVLERQGDQLLVAQLQPGQRLVSRGGGAIRRSSLMASGDAHGHQH